MDTPRPLIPRVYSPLILPFCLPSIFKDPMPPSTRAVERPSTPPSRAGRKEYTTPKKVAFFATYDAQRANRNVRKIAAQHRVSKSTAYNWIEQRSAAGSIALRRTRRRSNKLGRTSKASEEICKMLISPTKNPVRDQRYEAQIDFHNLSIKKRQLQVKLKEYTDGDQRYKHAVIRKPLR